MAKILLAAQSLTPTVVKLATALRHHQHRVTVLTSRDEDAVLPEGIELLRPFRKWSVVEAVRLAPILYTMQPQIVHLVLEEDRLNAAQIALGLIAKTLPHTVLTTSLLNIRQGLKRRNPVRYLLQESDIITCPSVETLGALRGLNMKSVRQGRGILPPALDFESEENLEERSGAVTELLKTMGEESYFVLPFAEPSFDRRRPFFRRLTLLASRRPVILLGSMDAWTLRERKRFQLWMHKQGLNTQWTLTGQLSRPDLRRLLAKSEAFVLAGQNLSPLEITEYFLHALQSGATLILDDRQSMIHSDLWRDSGNCWILPLEELLSRLQNLMSKETVRRPQTLPDDVSLQRELVDAPLNELNRLYNKALSLKHS